MAETSAIEWTDATVNFWWGCRKVGPGCDHCYAEALAKRFGIPDYDKSGVRRKIDGAIKLIRRLQRTAAKFEAKHGRRRRVFIQSMSDFFDNEVDAGWREEAWEEIMAADRLDIQIVTKRISNVPKMIRDRWPAHVGLIVTVVNQDEANRDIPRLLILKQERGIPWVGLSIEPMVGPVDLTWMDVPTPWRTDDVWRFDALRGRFGVTLMVGSGQEIYDGGGANGPLANGFADYRNPVNHPGIDWVIVGGESGGHARPLHPAWVEAIRDACTAAGVPFLFKQWGEWAPARMRPSGTPGVFGLASGGPASDMFPSSVVQIDCYPRQMSLFGGGRVMERVGKKAAGRSLYGRTHDGFPT